MPRKKIYNTPEERRLANNARARQWYQNHKNTEKFKKDRKYYQLKYCNGLSDTKKQFLREYNSDYIFYVRSVRTGRFERKIIKSKEELKKLESKIFNMEARLNDLKEKFGHLENTNDK